MNNVEEWTPNVEPDANCPLCGVELAASEKNEHGWGFHKACSDYEKFHADWAEERRAEFAQDANAERWL